MADIAKSGTPSICSPHGGTGPAQTTGFVAGEAIGALDAVYIKSDGKMWRSTGAAANAAAEVHGYAPKAYASGTKGCTMVHGSFNANYGAGITPGIDVYLSAAVAGAIADGTSTGGTRKLGVAIDATRIRFYSSQGR